ncbi:peptidase inhibitor family I36 protein [Streptomyces durbertensis]|uniref:Peptidase inhibitor family I36 protein n=1 Tax=Streptomyces durbertensis TaxID=2448886 RepID=A0ABR6E9V9_9ACTN|nr:peptidase inhibitor family I36 protein [Streptomyces durbertensis]MBB1242134.1 peptidase inhibitor family I36 protein [Streptomyces durbertensis]
MTSISKFRATLAAGAAVAASAAVLMAPGTANAASYSDCKKGNICFYTGSNGTGHMCQWDGNDSDWRGGGITCSWAGTHNVKSVYNNGFASGYKDVVYYTGANYQNRIGCTKVGNQGNLAGTYKLRSHKWVTSC